MAIDRPQLEGASPEEAKTFGIKALAEIFAPVGRSIVSELLESRHQAAQEVGRMNTQALGRVYAFETGPNPYDHG